jgi:hypothetical protein
LYVPKFTNIFTAGFNVEEVQWVQKYNIYDMTCWWSGELVVFLLVWDYENWCEILWDYENWCCVFYFVMGTVVSCMELFVLFWNIVCDFMGLWQLLYGTIYFIFNRCIWFYGIMGTALFWTNLCCCRTIWVFVIYLEFLNLCIAIFYRICVFWICLEFVHLNCCVFLFVKKLLI